MENCVGERDGKVNQHGRPSLSNHNKLTTLSITS